jgi:hypothetical protein
LTATERVLPSLALDFTTAVLDPRITFTRATTATFTGSDGLIQTAAIDAPRFDYNPTTLAPLGLLIEEQRTNLLLRSEEFQTTWVNERSSDQVNVIVSPAGTLTGSKLVEDTTATNTHLILQGLSGLASGSTLTFTMYLKAAERTSARLQINDGSSLANAVLANFDASTGIASATQSIGTFTGASSTITPVGDGWFRCSISGVATGVTAVQCRILLLSGTTVSYTGDGYSGIYIWGAQLEAGAFATSYIPTVASQVTRSADVAVMTGTNFSDWYNASQGAFVAGVRLNTLVTPAVKPVFAAYDGTFNSNRVYLNIGISGQTNLLVNSGGSSQANILGPILTANSLMKVSSKYKLNDFALTANGITPATDTSGVVPVGSNRLDIGSFQPASAYINGHVAFLNYYPLALTNNEVQAFSK